MPTPENYNNIHISKEHILEAQNFINDFEELITLIEREKDSPSSVVDERRIFLQESLIHRSFLGQLPFRLSISVPAGVYAETSYGDHEPLERGIKDFITTDFRDCYIDRSRERVDEDVIKIVFYDSTHSQLWTTVWGSQIEITPIFPTVDSSGSC